MWQTKSLTYLRHCYSTRTQLYRPQEQIVLRELQTFIQHAHLEGYSSEMYSQLPS